MERVSTGIRLLDRHLDGGLRPGSLTTLVASPASQVNPLFYEFIEDRSWLYLSTYRSARAVEEELDELLWGDVEVAHVGVDRPARRISRAISDMTGDRHVIVDPMTPVESNTDTGRYVDLLNGLKDYLLDTGRIALLYCTEQDERPALRETTLTMADVVWELEVAVESKGIETRLTVPKYRSRRAIDEVIKLDLGQEAVVDASKNIA
jgi:KaiC/GvpD/RAD55 family RecA-like ATPase